MEAQDESNALLSSKRNLSQQLTRLQEIKSLFICLSQLDFPSPFRSQTASTGVVFRVAMVVSPVMLRPHSGTRPEDATVWEEGKRNHSDLPYKQLLFCPSPCLRAAATRHPCSSITQSLSPPAHF